MDQEQQQQGTLRDLLYVIFKHKAKILTVFFTVVLTVGIGSFVMTPVYEATATILVKIGRENVYTPTTPAAGGGSQVLFDSSREERLNSAAEMIKGRNLIEKVIGDLGLKKIFPDSDKKPLFALPSLSTLLPSATTHASSPLEKATLDFAEQLEVETIKKSDLIEIRYQHEDPAVAAEVVNKLIDAFLEHHLRVYQQNREYNFFDDQVNLLKQRLEESERELEAFRQKNSISSLQEQRSLLLKQASELETEHARTRSEISEQESRVMALKGKSGAATPDSALGQETDLNPHAISAIRQRLSELRLREAELLSKYKEDNQLIVNIRKDIARAGELLATEEMTYHEKAITSTRYTLDALRGRDRTQLTQLSAYQRQLAVIDNLELKLKELDRRVKLNEDNYQLYLKHKEEARISNAMDSEKMANISIAQQALVPIKPVKPKKLLNVVLAILLGGFAGLGLAFFSEYFDRSFGKPEDLSEYLNVPVLASIPEMKK